jgi:hypothetical protein
VTVTLKSPWWERKVRARGQGTGAAAVDVPEASLRHAFDGRACAMGDLVIAAPRGSQPPAAPVVVAPARDDRPLSPTEPTARAEADSGSSAWVWTLTGSLLTGGGAVVFKFLGDKQYQELESTCAPTCSKSEVSDSGVKTSDALMVSLGITSGVLLITTIILGATGGDDDEQERAAHKPPGALLAGTF